MNVTGLLLAGGKSRRMGQDKSALKLGGKTLRQIQEGKLRALGLQEVLISAPDTLPDEIPGRGPLGGLYTGLRHAKGDCCLVLPVDVPLIPRETLEALLQDHEGGITVLQNGERIEPLIGIYDCALSDAIFDLIRDGGVPVMRLLDRVRFKTVPYTGESLSLANCNTPEDYHRISCHK